VAVATAAAGLARAQQAPGDAGMNVLIYLLPMALGLGLMGLFAFVWSLKNGQYEDLDGASVRMLSDDDVDKRAAD
jgi:cbb3-type cytochrome oxidase maturation protein